MPDTVRTESEILALLPDNTSGQISPQDMRDAVVSITSNQGHGWVFYSDSVMTSDSNPLSISSGVRTKITLDGAGAFTTTANRGTMSATSWNNNAFFPELDCAYMTRLTFKAKTAAGGSSNYFDLEFDIGAGGLGTGPVIWGTTIVLVKGAGNTHTAEFAVPMFAAAPFPANGGSFWITPSVDLDIWDPRFFAARLYTPQS